MQQAEQFTLDSSHSGHDSRWKALWRSTRSERRKVALFLLNFFQSLLLRVRGGGVRATQGAISVQVVPVTVKSLDLPCVRYDVHSRTSLNTVGSTAGITVSHIGTVCSERSTYQVPPVRVIVDSECDLMVLRGGTARMFLRCGGSVELRCRRLQHKHGLGRVRCPRESSGLVEVAGLIRIPASLNLRCMGATANRVFTRDEKDHEGLKWFLEAHRHRQPAGEQKITSFLIEAVAYIVHRRCNN